MPRVELFTWIQLGIAATFIAIAWFFFGPREAESQFGLREAERTKSKLPNKPAAPGLAQARLERQSPTSKGSPSTRTTGPFLLEGFVGDGNACDILGVPATADEKTIRSAHRELMKRYHPDLVGRPGSREWQDAQRIAETLNRARDELLLKLKQRS